MKNSVGRSSHSAYLPHRDRFEFGPNTRMMSRHGTLAWTHTMAHPFGPSPDNTLLRKLSLLSKE